MPTSSDAGNARRRLLHVFSTFAVGGPQARTARLVDCLGASAEHWLMAADGRLDGVEAFGLARRVHTIPERFAKGGGIAPRNLLLARDILRECRPDVLLTYNFGTIEAALAHRLWPAPCHLHFEEGFGPDEADGCQLTRRVWLRRLALLGRSKIVVPSRNLERIARSHWRFPASQVEYLPNGVDVTRFAPTPRPWPNAGVTVGTVCALRPEKNLFRLLRVLAAVPCHLVARIVIVGDGPERAALEAATHRLGLMRRVAFVGHVASPESVLREFDLFALTSDTEQMPLGVLEAMASGLPIVATDVGDVRHMLPAAQHPFVIARNDEAALASAVAVLAADGNRARQLGAGNRDHVCAHFPEDVMLRRVARLIGVSVPTSAPLARSAG